MLWCESMTRDASNTPSFPGYGNVGSRSSQFMGEFNIAELNQLCTHDLIRAGTSMLMHGTL